MPHRHVPAARRLDSVADARYRLAVAEDELASAQAKMKRADQAFDAASDQFNAAEAALDAAPGRNAPRPAGTGTLSDRASTAVARLQRRVAELSEQLDRMEPLVALPP